MSDIEQLKKQLIVQESKLELSQNIITVLQNRMNGFLSESIQHFAQSQIFEKKLILSNAKLQSVSVDKDNVKLKDVELKKQKDYYEQRLISAADHTKQIQKQNIESLIHLKSLPDSEADTLRKIIRDNDEKSKQEIQDHQQKYDKLTVNYEEVNARNHTQKDIIETLHKQKKLLEESVDRQRDIIKTISIAKDKLKKKLSTKIKKKISKKKLLVESHAK